MSVRTLMQVVDVAVLICQHMGRRHRADALFFLDLCLVDVPETRETIFREIALQWYGVVFWDRARRRKYRDHDFASWYTEMHHIERFQEHSRRVCGRAWEPTEFYAYWDMYDTLCEEGRVITTTANSCQGEGGLSTVAAVQPRSM